MTNREKIQIALSDPKAPWYGSDLVSWVADLLETEKLFEALLKEVKNDVYELYDKHTDTTPPELYGALLGIHTKIDMGLNGEYTPEALRQMPKEK